MHIDQSILDKVNEWLTPTFDNDTQNQIKEMMTTSPKNLEESFYKNLEFGIKNILEEYLQEKGYNLEEETLVLSEEGDESTVDDEEVSETIPSVSVAERYLLLRKRWWASSRRRNTIARSVV